MKKSMKYQRNKERKDVKMNTDGEINKKKSLAKKIAIGIVSLLLVAILGFVGLVGYVYFYEKPYTFFMPVEREDIQRMELSHDNETVIDSSVDVFDKTTIDAIMDGMKDVKIQSVFWEIEKEEEMTGKGFSIYIKCKEQAYSFIASENKNGYYVVYLGETFKDEDSILGRNDGTAKKMSKEQGDKLYDVVMNSIDENLKEVTKQELLKISEEKEYNWNKFEQYINVKDESITTKKTRDGITSLEVAKFPIENSESYMVVWYRDETIINGESITYIEEVCDAIVYNEDGEEMNLYDEGIATFLEEMK